MGMHDITAICGDRIKFDLPIFGEPLPEVVWTRTGCGPDGETEVIESTPDRNIVITNNESHTKLVINSVTKGLSGKYAIPRGLMRHELRSKFWTGLTLRNLYKRMWKEQNVIFYGKNRRMTVVVL